MSALLFTGRTTLLRDFETLAERLLDDGSTKKKGTFRAFSKQKEAEIDAIEPRLFLITGPNGSGKTTAAEQCLAIVQKRADALNATVTILPISGKDYACDMISGTPRLNPVIPALHQILVKAHGPVDRFADLVEKLAVVKEKIITAGMHNWLRDAQSLATDSANHHTAMIEWLVTHNHISAAERTLYETASQQLGDLIIKSLIRRGSETPLFLWLDDFETLMDSAVDHWILNGLVQGLIESKTRTVLLITSARNPLPLLRNIVPDEQLYWYPLENYNLTIKNIASLASSQNISIPDDLDSLAAATDGQPLWVQNALYQIKSGTTPATACSYSTPDNALITPIVAALEPVATRLIQSALQTPLDKELCADLFNCTIAEVSQFFIEQQELFAGISPSGFHTRVAMALRSFCIQTLLTEKDTPAYRAIKEFGTTAVEYYAGILDELRERINRIDERYRLNTWNDAVYNYCNALLWHDPDQFKNQLTGYLMETVLHNHSRGCPLISLADCALMSDTWRQTIKTIKTGWPDLDVSNPILKAVPSSSETAALKALETLYATGATPYHKAIGALFSAQLHVRDGHSDKALELCADCMDAAAASDSFTQSLLDTLVIVGNTLYLQQQNHRAITAFTCCITLKPDFYEAWLAIGLAHTAEKELRESIAAFDRALALCPDDNQVYALKGKAHYALDQFELAAAAFTSALENNAADIDLWHYLGRAQARSQHHAKAIAAFERVCQQRSENSEAWFELGTSQMAVGRPADAIVSFTRTVALDPAHYQAWQELGNGYFALERYSECITALKNVLNQASDNPAALNKIGVALYYHGQYEAAVDVLTEALEHNPENAELFNTLGLAYAAQNLHDKAIPAYDRAIALDKANYSLYNNKGYSQFARGNLTEAIASYDQAIAANAASDAAWFNKGVALHADKKYAAALNAYEQTLTLNPEKGEVWYNKGLAHHALEQWNEALTAYTNALELDASLTDIWFNKGLVHAVLSQHDQTIEALTEARTYDPENSTVHLQLGIAQSAIAQPQAALNSFNEALRLMPDWHEALILKSKACLELDKTEEAIATIKEVLAQETPTAELWYLLGTCYVKIENQQDAAAAFCEALLLNPQWSDTAYQAGLAFHSLQNHSQAIIYYEQAHRQNPEQVGILYNIALCHHALGNLNEAIITYQKAIELSPDDPALWYNMGLCYQLLRQYAHAVETYRQTLELDPTLADAWFNLGLSCHALGQKTEATQAYRKTLELKPDDEEATLRLSQLSA